MSTETTRGLDALDTSILSILMTDGRSTNADIAGAVARSEATMRRRIEAMLNEGVFQIIALADNKKLGLDVQTFIGIKVEYSKLHQVAERLAVLEPIRHLVITTGPYNLFAHAFLADNDELSSFLTKDLAAVEGIISADALVILSLVKRTWDYQLKSPAIREARPRKEVGK